MKASVRPNHINLNLAIAGATGRMGKEILSVIAEHDNLNLTAIIGKNSDLTNLDLSNTQVFIDFSVADAITEHLDLCVSYGIAAVIGVTGLNEKQKKAIEEASNKIPILYSANMSFGANICYKLVESTEKMLAKSLVTWDIAIQDLHHKNKKDAPSGTSKHLAEMISDPNLRNNLQFSSIRAGDIVGEHTVSFIADGERIEIAHRANDRKIFAKGAIYAAQWIYNQKPKLYNMLDAMYE